MTGADRLSAAAGAATDAGEGAAARDASGQRAILHLDMDAFFAAVEVLDRPELAGRPLIVGGAGPRGVVASCTYEARAFGVRSALPSVRARQLCPAALFVDGRFDRYRQVSRRLHELMLAVTPWVEGLGLDEAFLDVSGARRLLGPPAAIARALRTTVDEELGLGCSIGVATNKLVAKLASRAAKPLADLVEGRPRVRPGPGVFEVPPGAERAFLEPLPVGALWGVGPATARRLAELGVTTVRQLTALPEDVVVRRLGETHGRQLVQLARGVDPRPVVAHRPAKSIGHEETFERDLHGLGEVAPHVHRMAAAVAGHLGARDLACRTVTVKVRAGDFTTTTRSKSVDEPVDEAGRLAAVAAELLEASGSLEAVRLVGVSASGLVPRGEARQPQLPLAGTCESGDAPADHSRQSREELGRAAEAVRQRFGPDILRHAGAPRD